MPAIKGDPTVTAPYRGATSAPVTEPLPPHPPSRGLLKVGITAPIHEVNAAIQQITDGHQRLFGHSPSPGLVYDIVRGWSQNKVPDVARLFDIPTSQQEADARSTAPPVAPTTPATPQMKAAQRLATKYGVDLAHLQATDPHAGEILAAAQGKPLNKVQEVNLGETQGKTTRVIGDKELTEAGFLPKFVKIHDEHSLWNIATAGAFEFSLGLIAAPVVLSITEGNAIVQSVKQGSLKPLGGSNKNLAKQAVVGLYHDTRAVLTGDTQYIYEHPDSIYQVAFLGLGAAGTLSKMSAATSVLKSEGAVAAAKELALPREPAPKKLTISGDRGEYSVDAINFTNPLVRAADNLMTSRMKARYDKGLEPVGAAALRRAKLNTAADFLSKTTGYAAKFRREDEALYRSKYAMSVHLAHQLDQVTATSIDAADALKRVAEPTKKQLSIGELKAMEVIQQGGDWREAFQTMSEAHADWRDASLASDIQDYAKAHQAQLAALKLAKPVLEDLENGIMRKPFRQALPAYLAAIDETTRLKVEHLGLDPDSAAFRENAQFDIFKNREPLANRKGLARLITNLESSRFKDSDSVKAQIKSLRSLLTQTEDRVADMEKREGSSRVPYRGREQVIGGGSGPTPPAIARTPYGRALPEMPSELTHSFTGKAIMAGDYRLDFTNIAAKDLGRTVGAIYRLDDYKKKLASSVKTLPSGPTAKFYAPIRVGDITGRWRELVNKADEPGLTAEEVSQLTDKEVEAWNDMAYGARKLEDGSWVVKGGGDPKNYRFYDTRAFADSERVEHDATGIQKFLSQSYNIVGRPRIYLAPRYLLNTISNKHMLLLTQGPWTPVSLAASHYAVRLYGRATVDRIDSLMGSSRSMSYAPTVEGALSQSITAVAHVQHILTDLHDRRAAFLYRAWKAGYRSAADIERLVTDEGLSKRLSEVNRRANKDVVELDNLTWAEKENWRHLMFVYPWRSRQAIWSIRTLAEHPGQAAILSEIGDNGLQSEFENAPHWLKQAFQTYAKYGYVPTGWNHDGSPKGVAAGQINTYSGLMDLLTFNVAGSAGPGAQFVSELFTKKDSHGRDLPGGSLSQAGHAFLDVVIDTQPIKQATDRRARKNNEPGLPPFNWADRHTIIKRLNAAQRQAVLSPGWLGGFGLILTGGFTPRSFNREKLLYNYYHSLDSEGRYKFELNSIHTILKIQSGLLGQPIPKGVMAGVNVTADTSHRMNVLSDQGGYPDGIPDKIHDDILLKTLKDHGLINNKQLAEEEKRIPAGVAAEAQDHAKFRSQLFLKYAGGSDLANWNENVKLLHSYTPTGYKGKIARLGETGLISGSYAPGSQESLMDVGRKVVAYETKVQELSKAISDESDNVRKSALRAQLVDYTNAADSPLKINGRTYPSAPRLSYADVPAADRQTHRVSSSLRKWDSLSSLDKEILTGKPVDPVVDAAWAAIDHRMAQEKVFWASKGQSVPAGTKAVYVKRVAAQSPAFREDLAFARKPLAERMLSYKPVQELRSPEWKTLLTTARDRAKQYIKAGGAYVTDSGAPNWTVIQRAWVRDDLPQIEAKWLPQASAAFRAELARFTDRKPRFLYDLVRP